MRKAGLAVQVNQMWSKAAVKWNQNMR